MIPRVDLTAALANPNASSVSKQEVLQSFEAVFIAELIGGLWDALSEEWGAGPGVGKPVYGMWFKQTLAQAIAESGGIGIASGLQACIDGAEAAGGALDPGGGGSAPGDPGTRLKIFAKEPISRLEPCSGPLCRRYEAVQAGKALRARDHPLPLAKETDP
jgi:hypothetical protein